MNKTRIHKTKSIVILVMAFLLLIAPCSFRNNLESSLEIATTKPLNPSKSLTTPLTSCDILENNTGKNSAQFSQKQIQKKCTIIATDNFTYTVQFKKTHYLQTAKGSIWNPPYYILYKRLKIFDLTEINLV